MSTIFITATDTVTRPRLDATIRVEVTDGQYVRAALLEFHPDTDHRMKMRGYALVRPNEHLTRPNVGGVYQLCGVGWLEQPYAWAREFIIHPDDREEMYRWCKRAGTSLIVHKQPLPFPMFAKRTRVVVVAYKDEHTDTEAAGQVGQLAMVTEASSPGGMTDIRFDQPELNQGYKFIGMPSIALREPKSSMSEHDDSRERQRVDGQAALNNWQALYDWTTQQPAGEILGRSCTNSDDPLCRYLGAATNTRPSVWSIGPSIKTGYEERLNKPIWVKMLIEETDKATGNESGPVSRELYLSILKRVKP